MSEVKKGDTVYFKAAIDKAPKNGQMFGTYGRLEQLFGR